MECKTAWPTRRGNIPGRGAPCAVPGSPTRHGIAARACPWGTRSCGVHGAVALPALASSLDRGRVVARVARRLTVPFGFPKTAWESFRNGPWHRRPSRTHILVPEGAPPVSYTHLRAHETPEH